MSLLGLEALPVVLAFALPVGGVIGAHAPSPRRVVSRRRRLSLLGRQRHDRPRELLLALLTLVGR